MAEVVGKIAIRVIPDTKGFRQRTKKEVESQVKSLRPKVKVGADTSGIRRDVNNAAGRAAKGASGKRVRFGADLDSNGLGAKAKAAAKAVSTNKIKFGVEIDRRGLSGLSRSIKTGFASVDTANTLDIIGKIHAGLARMYQGLAKVRKISASVNRTLLEGFKGFGRPLKKATSAVRTLGRSMIKLWDRSELLQYYRTDVVDAFSRIGDGANRQFGKVKARAGGALESVRARLTKIGESDAWIKMGRGAEAAARHIRNITSRPIIPIKGRYSAKQAEKLSYTIDVDASEARSKIAAAAKGHKAKIDVEPSGISGYLRKMRDLKRTVDRTTTAKNIVGKDLGLAAAYGAFKGWRQVKNVLGLVGKYAAIAGVALTALAPPLMVLGSGAAMGIFGALGGAAAALTVVGNLGLGALFVGMAARSEEVQEAWSDARKSMAETFDAANKPVENSLIDLAPQVASAFARMQPNIARVSHGVAGLLDRFATTLPDLADATGKAMEQIFEAGRPGAEKLIDGLPKIVSGLGDAFQILGESKAIKRIWDGMVDGLPGFFTGMANALDWSARAAGRLHDWFRSDGLSEFRDGFSRFADKFANLDWSRFVQGAEDVFNSFGTLFGDMDVQGVVDDLGKVSTAISKVIDAFNQLGFGGTIAMGIVAGIAKGVAAELTGALVGFGARKLIEWLFGSTSKIAEEAKDIGIGVAGGLLEGLLEGLVKGIASGFGEAIGRAIGDLFLGKREEDVIVNIEEINWPEGQDGLVGNFKVESIQWPNDEESLSGIFQITEVKWPDDLEHLTGIFEITEIVWPMATQHLTGVFEITEVIFPEDIAEKAAPFAALTSVFEYLTTVITALNEQLMLLVTPFTVIPPLAAALGASLFLVGTSLTLISTGLFSVTEAMTLFAEPVTTLIGVVSSVIGVFANWVSSISGVLSGFSLLDGGLLGSAASFQNFLGTVGAVAGGVVGFVSGMASTVVGAISSAISTASGFWSSGWSGMLSAVMSLGGQAVAFASSIPGRISSAFSGLGGMLIGSGQALIQGFINGIRSMVGAAVSAAQSVVSAVRNLFPFSPAKEGPFSGKGYTTHSGRALVQDFAGGMLDSRGDARDAIAKVMGDVKSAIDEYPKAIDRYNTDQLIAPTMRGNAKKIADFRKKEAEAMEKGNADVAKLAEDRHKMLESLEVPDYRELNRSIQSYYIDGTKGMFNQAILKHATDTQFSNQLRDVAKQAVREAREIFGDHPVMAQIEANVDAEHFQWSIEEAIKAADLGSVPIDFAIANLDQLKSDLGFGDGALTRGFQALLEFNPNETDAYRYEKGKTEVHYHVTDLEEAMRLEDERRRRGALRYV